MARFTSQTEEERHEDRKLEEHWQGILDWVNSLLCGEDLEFLGQLSHLIHVSSSACVCDLLLEGAHLGHVVVHVGHVPLGQKDHGEHEQSQTESGHGYGLVPFQPEANVELKGKIPVKTPKSRRLLETHPF